MSQEIKIITTADNIPLNCDCIDGSLFNSIKKPNPFSCVSYRSPGYRISSETETLLCKKVNKTVLNKILVYLEGDEKNIVDFNGETITFTFF